MTKTCVDTSIFMNKLKYLEDNLDKVEFAIPLTVLEELDNLKENRDYEKSFRARRSLRFIENNKDKFEFITECDKFEGLDSKNDNTIIKVCIDNGFGNKYKLLTNDLSMKIKAEALGIEVIVVDDKDSEYKGYRMLEIDTNVEEDNELLASLYQQPEQNKFDLFINEYLIIRDKACPLYDDDYDERIGYKTLDILRWDGYRFVQLKLPPKKVVNPLNDLQKCALDLLMNKDIPIKVVCGKAGSGKTYMATKVGIYNMIDKGYYSKIMMVRNPYGSGEEIGFLPGSKSEKIKDFFNPIIQHLDFGEMEAEKLMQDGRLIAEIPFYMKGLDIQETYVIVDESEDIDIKTIRLIGSRVSRNTSIVFTGDYKQAESKFKGSNNGLMKLIEVAKNSPLFGCVVLKDDLRSEASKLFADLL